MEKFDVIIIGSGQGGNPIAHAFADAGLKTAMIERKLVGGTCVNYGCTPSKTMIASGKVADMIKRSSEYGIHLNDVQVKMQEIVQRKNKMVKSSHDAVKEGLEKADNLTLIKGAASFSGKYELNVKTEDGIEKVLSAEKIIIDTGTRNKIPDIEGLKEVTFYDTTSIMDLEEVPAHLVIIGGGYNGLELGQLFLRLGSRITVIEVAEKFLPKEDEDVSDEIKKVLSEDGMTFHINSQISRVEQKDKAVEVFFKENNNEQNISGSHLLIAAGRKPNTDDMGVEKAGIDLDDKGYIKVNEMLETNVTGIYAIGDVKGGPAFTHISYDDYRILKSNMIDKKQKTTQGRMIPYCMFTDPELGRVGITEIQAKEKGIEIKVAKMEMNKVARASQTGHPKGLMKAVVDAETDEILGVAVFGEEGGEIMNMLEIAMMGRLTYQQLRDGIFAHPTYGESLNNLFASL